MAATSKLRTTTFIWRMRPEKRNVTGGMRRETDFGPGKAAWPTDVAGGWRQDLPRQSGRPPRLWPHGTICPPPRWPPFGMTKIQLQPPTSCSSKPRANNRAVEIASSRRSKVTVYRPCRKAWPGRAGLFRSGNLLRSPAPRSQTWLCARAQSPRHRHGQKQNFSGLQAGRVAGAGRGCAGKTIQANPSAARVFGAKAAVEGAALGPEFARRKKPPL